MVEGGVDGRIDDRRAAAVVLADSGGDVPRDGDVLVHPPGRRRVPAGQAAEGPPVQAVAQPADALAPEVGVELVPGVPHGGEAVAQVVGASGRNDRLRDAVAGADDEVEVVEVELLDRHGKQTEVAPVVAPRPRQELDEGAARPRRVEARRDGAGDVQQREHLGAGQELRQRLEHLLAAAHPGEPVVHERDARAADVGRTHRWLLPLRAEGENVGHHRLPVRRRPAPGRCVESAAPMRATRTTAPAPGRATSGCRAGCGRSAPAGCRRRWPGGRRG